MVREYPNSPGFFGVGGAKRAGDASSEGLDSPNKLPADLTNDVPELPWLTWVNELELRMEPVNV